MDVIGIVGWMVTGLIAGGFAGAAIRDGETWESAFVLAIGITLAGAIVTGSVGGAILGLITALAMAKRVSWLRAEPHRFLA